MKIDMTDSESEGISTTLEKIKHDSRSDISSFQLKGSSGITVNEESLKREMGDILGMMASYLKDIEAAARTRRIKRTNHITGDYKDFCKGEKRFLMRLEYGKGVMNAIIESLKVVPDIDSGGKLTASELYTRINDFVQKSSERSTADNIQEMSFYLGELMIRFARICESEGFRHGLPINAYPPLLTSKERTYMYRRNVKKILNDGEEKDENGASIETMVDVRNDIDVPENRLSSEGITFCDIGTDADGYNF
ncbi:uncharacterized protein [Halyomorpha halys]|uniref:uncharacterized protein n=1 Tax=Halyomorpha halys TaxID=286706 RepID=UPI0006D4CBA6|nr:uncharacterized protein LOC106690707 [Halyomorpha halys]